MLNGLTIAVIGQLTQAIRNFAKNLEGWLKSALVGAPDDIIKIKVSTS